MNTLKIEYDGEASLAPAAEIIRNGGIVAFPTETVYGLGGNALDPDAARKIYAAKGRPSDNPLIVHLADPRDAEKYCVTSDAFYRIADAFMPGPITVILPKKPVIPDSVTGGLDTVGVRVPSHRAANQLIRLSGVPIAAPSANISGKPSPTRFEHIEHDLDGRVDALIDGGDCDFGVESTIIKINGSGILLLRPGAVTVEMLSLFCDRVTVDRAVTEKFDGVPMAPGMKYRHYAPDCPLTVIDGSDMDFRRFVAEKEGSERFGVICFDEDLPYITCQPTVSCGPEHDQLRQAQTLFSCLRSFDGVCDIDMIYARMPSRNGIGLAVFNRLIKAAGFHVVKL